MVNGKDIREEGDRNPGAGNVYVSIGPKAGFFVGVVDLSKGVAAVLMTWALPSGGGVGPEMAAGVAAAIGHNWPIYMKFRGGRGAATTVGVYWALMPIPAIPLSLATLALLFFVRRPTLALGIIMIPMPLLAWIFEYPPSVILFTILLPAGVGLRHYMTSKNNAVSPQPPPLERQVQESMLSQG